MVDPDRVVSILLSSCLYFQGPEELARGRRRWRGGLIHRCCGYVVAADMHLGRSGSSERPSFDTVAWNPACLHICIYILASARVVLPKIRIPRGEVQARSWRFRLYQGRSTASSVLLYTSASFLLSGTASFPLALAVATSEDMKAETSLLGSFALPAILLLSSFSTCHGLAVLHWNLDWDGADPDTLSSDGSCILHTAYDRPR